MANKCKTKKQRLIHKDEIMRAVPELARMDSDDGQRGDSAVIWFQSELETRLAETYTTERAAYQFANGEVLPLRGTVPARDGEMGYTYMWDHAGQAKWLSAGSDTDIPLVSINRKRISYTVHRFALGWKLDMDDIARAREREGMSLEIVDMEAVAEGLDSWTDDVAFSGDASKGLTGLTTITNMTVLFAVAGTGGAYRWSTEGATEKTAKECKRDIDTMRRVMRALTKMKHDITHVWMPPTFWERTTSVFIANTSKTLREHLIESYPGVKWMEVRRLESAGTYGGPVIMAAKLTTEKDCWIEQPGHLVPGEIERKGESITGYMKSFSGGVICMYPLRFVRMDFAAD